MKVLAISDVHNYQDHLKLPENIDLLILAGDIIDLGTKEEMENFLRWFDKQKVKRTILVPGNHDLCLEVQTDYWKKTFNQHGITQLIHEYIEIDGIKIFGSPYTPNSGKWAFQKNNEEEFKSLWNSIPKGLDILITHGPPYGILDEIRHGEHIGDQSLLKKILENPPRFHFFGHAHFGVGIESNILTTFCNCAATYKLRQGHFVPQIWEINIE